MHPVTSPTELNRADLRRLMAAQWWLLLLRGVLAGLFGIVALVAPLSTFAALLILFGAFVVCDGAMTVATAFSRRARHDDGWWRWLFDGLLSLTIGLMALFWPAETAVALAIWIAVWAIAAGVLRLLAAISLRREIEGEWTLALSGLAMILLGVVMIALPQAAVASWSWLIGLFALLISGMMITLALRLRGLRG